MESVLDKIRGLSITIFGDEDGSVFIDNNEGTTLTLTLEEVKVLAEELNEYVECALWKKERKRQRELAETLAGIVKQTPMDVRLTSDAFHSEVIRLYQLNDLIRENYDFAAFYDACVNWRNEIKFSGLR